MIASFFVLVGAAGGFAQTTIDAKIMAAMESFAAVAEKPPLDVAIGDITIADTQSVSSFSLYLANKITQIADTAERFRVIRTPLRVRTNTIEGSFIQNGNTVTVTLHLSFGAVRAKTAEFTVSVSEVTALGLTLLPQNRQSVNAIKSNGAFYVADTERAEFSISAQCDSPTRVYYDGEKLRITLEADTDCYFKIYDIDTTGFMQLIYPNNTGDKNNLLKAHKSRTVPEKSEFVVRSPFGEDTILVVASTVQFADLDAEMSESAVRAAKESVSRALTRGIAVAGGGREASCVFSFTSLPLNIIEDEFVYDFGKDADGVKSAVSEMQKSVKQVSGVFGGDEKKGAFTTKSYSGEYAVTDGKMTLRIRHPAEQSVTEAVRSNTRSAIAGGYRFTFDKPGNITQAVTQVKTGIQKKGGNFKGDENAGEFSVIGIAGMYAITGEVSVTITEKPGIISIATIEKEVKKFFGVN
ncbi:MAG: hypothetical protein Ta2A_05510 [Treponemataceae bacterium]|nr:MAG: hypothetical protein Ta2A_05510 [Treponemataceae bacterium]